MDEKKRLVEEVRRIIELFYQGTAFWKSGYYELGMSVSTMDLNLSNNASRIITYLENLGRQSSIIHHGSYAVSYMEGRTAVAVGYYHLQLMQTPLKVGRRHEITMVLQNNGKMIKVRHIHISSKCEEQICEVKDINERNYRLKEDEILYLEARHNHVLWHCKEKIIEAVCSLKAMEKVMPEYFIRIHKSLLVNRKHVREIARYYVVMDNGENLPIPVKRYLEVKKQLEEDVLIRGEEMK